MHKIHVDLGSESYDIAVASGIIRRMADLLRPLVKPSRIMIISNPTVFRLYGELVQESLLPLQCEVVNQLIPDGEEHKNLDTVENLLDAMVEARLDRKSLIIGLGGGVVGDIAGFVAAIYMRGLSYAHAPTTLLAQVDSSIGGKVGVDHKLGKNLIGAFHQPVIVCTDPDVLSTLSERQYRNGLAEIVKCGVIADEGLFSLLERRPGVIREIENGILTDTIKRCCQIKARIVQQDVRETTGLRAILNYGHTVGHAIESVTNYSRYNHGEAVAVGMAVAAKIAVSIKLAPLELEERQERLLVSVGLPTRVEKVSAEHLLEAMRLDKKASGGKPKFVLPIAIGRGIIKENIPQEVVERALREVGAE
jgi:3-dehydroquinate synthase